MLEESIYKISGQLSTISRNQKYFRTRENRNFSTVRSTEKRIFNFSIIEGGMMVAMAGLQVFIVRFFFQGARKGKLPLPYSILFSTFRFFRVFPFHEGSLPLDHEADLAQVMYEYNMNREDSVFPMDINIVNHY